MIIGLLQPMLNCMHMLRMASAIPLKDRICRSSHFSGPLGHYHPLLTEVGWDETGMSKAYAVIAGIEELQKSTMRHYTIGLVEKLHSSQRVRTLRYLDSDEELELANFISAIGYSRSMK